MHGPIWRLDIDLDGFWAIQFTRSAYRNLPGATATDTAPMIKVETGCNGKTYIHLAAHPRRSLRIGRGTRACIT